MKPAKFVDEVRMFAAAGRGGDGCVSFRREKYVPRGGPDGGDGGHGGNVILQGDENRSSLLNLFYAPHQQAGDGTHGRGKQQHGKNGKDRIVPVPCGTEVWDAEECRLLQDITGHGQQFLAARAGKGGLGNTHWKSSTHQAPTERTRGEPGEENVLVLRLKLMANAGLVGFPNAGKSSLLRRLSHAHPKVAAYPFTTLNPIIGTVIFDDYSRGTVADVPGLITGAHKGAGLGHAFLRHIERASALIYVVDVGATDGRKPEQDYEQVRRELEMHRKDLVQRPSLLVANKIDLPGSEERMHILEEKAGRNALAVSAKTGEGIEALTEALFELLRGRTH